MHVVIVSGPVCDCVDVVLVSYCLLVRCLTELLVKDTKTAQFAGSLLFILDDSDS